MQKIKIKCHSVQKLEWKKLDGQMDGRTNKGDSITSHANVIDKKCHFCAYVFTNMVKMHSENRAVTDADDDDNAGRHSTTTRVTYRQ